MAIVFFYDIYSIAWIESIISACILIIANLLIIKSGKSQPEGVKNSNLLVRTGIISIIIAAIIPFIPNLQFSKLTPNEYPFYKIYSLIVMLIVPISSLVTYGIFITIFGQKNYDELEKPYTAAGVSMIISNIIQIIVIIFYITCLIDYYIYYPGFSIDLMWSVYLILVNFPITTYLLAVVLLYGLSKFNNDKFMHTGAILILAQFVFKTNIYWILRIILQI